jgi:hypothetical protein
MSRNWQTDAALRPEPKRPGLDVWPTPSCLAAALVRDVLPVLPEGRIWEPAAGSGVLVQAMTAAGRDVIASDAELDFLSGAVPPDRIASIVTNPPFNVHSGFIQRGLQLLDDGTVAALVLLFRHDHLQSESRHPPHCRLAAFRRASRVVICPWRPRWIPDTTEAPRWSFSWVTWLRDAAGPTVIDWSDSAAR